ncbi:uncharacterized protein LOC143252964 [Tachypleus tridentatus]|uniref:uncharacterized protein LOC143252964 n=1 Tax=Tachypleus tridentatus TaxID=6853 RepID=UPI003FD59FBE
MSSAWSQLEQLLTCAICLDRYRNPKLLPCQHTFCMDPCLEGLIDYARRQIKCPECRAEHRIPYQGVQTFPTNVTLMRFLELHRNVTGEEPEPPPSMMERCTVCSEKAYLNKCAHCDKKVCDECREAHTDILRRDISRINNQVKRGLHRLSDALTLTQSNTEKLQQNCTRVKHDIEELVRRYTKDLKDTEKKLLMEIDEYLETEVRQMKQLKDGLETEVENLNSNSELIGKYLNDDMEWTDTELVEYKEIFLKTLEFIRNFEIDTSDFARRVKFQLRTDPDVLRQTLIGFGELNISSLTVMPSVTTSPPFSNTLMRSQSDHRLASQFQRRQEGRTLLDVSKGIGGHTSDSEKDGRETSYGRIRRDYSERNSYRRFGERKDYDLSDRERSRSRFLRDENGLLLHRNWRDSDADIPTYRPRFTKDHSDEGHESEVSTGRSVRFEDLPEQQDKLFEKDDVTKGPLSGVIKLVDSPHFMERLHQNEVRQKQHQEEKEHQERKQTNLAPISPVPTIPQRQTSRQFSEDEIERQKKQNQAAAAATPQTATVTVVSPVLSTSPTPLVSPSSTPTILDSPVRPISKRIATLQKNDASTNRPRSPEFSQGIQRSGTSSPDGSTEGSLSSRQSSQQDEVAESPPPRPARRRTGSSATGQETGRPEDTTRTRDYPLRQREAIKPLSRSVRPPLGKSQSLDVEEQQIIPPITNATSRNKGVCLGRSSSLDKKEDERKTPVQSSFYGRLLSQRVSIKPQVPEEEEEEASDTESESEVSSTETESEEQTEKKKTSVREDSPSVTAILSRSAQIRRESNDSSKKEVTGAVSSRFSQYARAKDEEEEKNCEVRRNSLIHGEEPNPQNKYGILRRRPVVEDETGDSAAYSRYLSRCRTSTGLGESGSNHDENSENLSRNISHHYSRDSRFGSNYHRSRIARSKSSADIVAGEDSPEEELPLYESHTDKFEDGNRRSRNVTNLKFKDDSPPENNTPNGSSSWALYLRNKYGSRSSTGPSRSVIRSRSSHSLYSRSGSDNSSDEESPSCHNQESPASGAGNNQSYSFNFPRSIYVQKRKMIMKVGIRGSEPSCFTWPRGVCVGPENTIVVADSSNHRVQVFDSSGKFLQEFGTYGNAEGEFDCLAGVAVNRIGQFIVSDRYNHRIQVFDPSGRFLRAFGCEGRTDGRFSYPWGITTDSLGFIYVCDKENHRIQVFQSDGSFVGKFGSIGSRPGQLEHPHYIAVSNTNRVIVSDSNNHRIQIFDVNGRSLSTFGSEGSEEGQFKFPRGVAVDDQGYIMVGDSGNNRIQIFHPDGSFLRSFGTWGAGDGEFKGLEGIAVMSNGNILVCDRENHRIQMF